MEDILDTSRQRMGKSIDALRAGLAKTRAGRAQPALIDSVLIDYYGSQTPLSQAATINVLDAHTLSISPWDKSLTQNIEKAILGMNLGLNPVVTGDTIKVPLPALSEERRRELIKVLRAEAEQTRVAIRNIRRDAKQACKEQVKNKEMTEDQERHAEQRLQKLTNKFIAEVDALLKKKEQEMLEL